MSTRTDKASFLVGALALLVAVLAILASRHRETLLAADAIAWLGLILAPVGGLLFALGSLTLPDASRSWLAIAVLALICAGVNGVSTVLFMRGIAWARDRARPVFLVFVAWGVVAIIGAVVLFTTKH